MYNIAPRISLALRVSPDWLALTLWNTPLQHSAPSPKVTFDPNGVSSQKVARPKSTYLEAQS